jgi:hypothetical protein
VEVVVGISVGADTLAVHILRVTVTQALEDGMVGDGVEAVGVVAPLGITAAGIIAIGTTVIGMVADGILASGAGDIRMLGATVGMDQSIITPTITLGTVTMMAPPIIRAEFILVRATLANTILIPRSNRLWQGEVITVEKWMERLVPQLVTRSGLFSRQKVYL